ncbi:MAG: hypothetical protein IJB86_06195 [Clostridia bacterium]|nr:hypothetical protein [Clostridia bacterium]
MRFVKKIAVVLLAILLVLCSVSIAASAEGETGSITINLTADRNKGLYPGDIITFTINIANDFNYTAMRWPVMFTTKAFELVTVDNGSDTDVGNVKGYGALAGAESVLESAVLPSTAEAFGGTYAKTTYSGLLIQWTAGTTAAGLAYYNEPAGSNCITFQLRVKDAPTVTSGKVIIPTTTQCKNFFYYQGIADPSDASTIYKMNSTTCTVNSTGETISVYKVSASISPKTGSDTVIDEERGYIYGFTTTAKDFMSLDEDVIANHITCEGGATYELETNDAGCYSTGAKLKAFDANGKSIGEYELVVFGDINGDSVTDASDVAVLIDAYLYIPEWSWEEVDSNATMFSCDTNVDGLVTADDYAAIEIAMMVEGYIDQTYTEGVDVIYF